MKKYKLLKGKGNRLELSNRTLYRIKALRSFSNVKKGEIGGYIESTSNLAQNGTCWIYNSACVYGSARVSGSARVYDSARISGSAYVSGSARIYGLAHVADSASVYRSAQIYGSAYVSGSACISDTARVYGSARVFGSAGIYSSAHVTKPKECVHISGQGWPLTITPQYIFIGCQSLKSTELAKITKKRAVQLGCPKEKYPYFKKLITLIHREMVK